jgi:hypothetical protein
MGTRPLLVYVEVSLLGKRKTSTMKNREALVEATTQVGPEVVTRKKTT